ncbi:MAG TPA: hypothetical protein VIL65_15165 [Beijerinckiaceae bacterium]|jgi:predicted transcriptional regulator
MTKKQIADILERVKTWPLERQEDAAEMLLAMEELEGGVYKLTPEEEADIAEAEAEMERGEIATDEEVAAVFNRFRG